MKITTYDQQLINYSVMTAYDEAMKERVFASDIPVKRLRHCNAEVWETETYYILKSYKTTVAVIDKRTNELFDALRLVYGYTATSAQHISKFARDYGADEIYRAYPV